MKAMVGSSILHNSYDAGVETAKNSLRGIRSPKIGFVFTSSKYNQSDFLSGIKSVNSEIKVIGCTSNEMVMTPDGIINSEDGFAGMMVLEDNELIVGVAMSEGGNDPRLCGRNVAREAMINAEKKYPPIGFAMFSNPEHEEEYLKGIQDIIGELPMFGGSASSEKNYELKIMCEDKDLSNGCAIAIFYTTKEINNIFTGDYEETDNIGIITKTENKRKIVEIDQTPALKKYMEWLNLSEEELTSDNITQKSTTNPLGIKGLHSDLIAIRHILGTDYDNSLKVGADIYEKTAVIFMNNTVDGLIESTVKNIKKLENNTKPAALLLLQSAGRKECIEDRIDENFVAIKNATGDTPFIVAFTNSEFGQVNHSGATVSNLSLSFTSFSE